MKKFLHKSRNLGTAFTIAITCFACSPADRAQFSSLTSQMLGQAGLSVSSTQVDSLLDAGEKVNAAARGLSPEEEYYIGRGVSSIILGKYHSIKKPSVISYVNKVGNALSAVSDRPELFSGYHFQVLDSKEINALSAPAGFVFITSGFLKAIPDEDALAAVLAHEVAHIVLGHGTAAISQSNITSALTAVGKQAVQSQGGSVVQELNGYFGDSISDVTNALLEKGYSRSQEYEADEMAVTLLQRAGYSTNGIISMLKSIDNTSHDQSGWYATHPAPAKRISNIEDSVSKADSAGRDERTKRFKTIVAAL